MSLFIVIAAAFICICMGVYVDSLKKQISNAEEQSEENNRKISRLEEDVKYSLREIKKLQEGSHLMYEAMSKYEINSYGKAAEMIFKSYMAVSFPENSGKQIIAAIEKRTVK